MELQIFLEGLGCTFGRDHLIALERSFADQVHALPVIRFGSCRIGGDDFVERCNCSIHLARIGENRTLVEKVRGGVRRIQLGGLVIVGYGIIDLIRLRISFGKVVIVGSHFCTIVGILLCRLRRAPQLNCLLVIGCGHLVTLLFLFGIGLLGGRHAVGIAEFEPDQIAGVVDLVGFIQGGDCGLEVAGIGSRFGGIKFFVECADGFLFTLDFGGSLRPRFGLFRGHSLGLGCVHLFFLQVDVLHRFVQAHRDVSKVKKFLAVLAELDVVLAGDDTQGEVLTLVVSFEFVGVARLSPGPFYVGPSDRLAFRVFTDSFHGARGLRERQGNG